MKQLHEILTQIYQYMASHDIQTLSRQISNLDMATLATSIYTWVIGVPILICLLWTKKFKLIIAFATFCLFLVLLQKTIMNSGDKVNLQNVLSFVGGTTALIALNLYLFFIRQ
ncbi:MAG: hypothetical protein ACP5IL_10290 [Syntrophobacteraceae bacterium]